MWHIACVRDIRIAYKFLVKIPERNGPTVRCRWRIILEWIARKLMG